MDPRDIVKMLHRELIEVENGKIKENCPKFFKFKNKNFHIWGDVMEILELLEEVMAIYSLTNVRIFTDKIVEYA